MPCCSRQVLLRIPSENLLRSHALVLRTFCNDSLPKAGALPGSATADGRRVPQGPRRFSGMAGVPGLEGSGLAPLSTDEVQRFLLSAACSWRVVARECLPACSALKLGSWQRPQYSSDEEEAGTEGAGSRLPIPFQLSSLSRSKHLNSLVFQGRCVWRYED